MTTLHTANERLALCTERREHAFEMWVESAPGTDDGDTLWAEYQQARYDELAAKDAFIALWRAQNCPVIENDIVAQLQATLDDVRAQKQRARSRRG